jgi:hypothetical protein
MQAPNNNTLRLNPSNTRTAILFVAMLVWFLLGAARFVMVGGLLMLALAAVGLVGAVVYGVMLLPNSSYLEATPEGLTISSAFRKRSYAWSHFESFYVDTILSKQVVKYELTMPEDDAAGADTAGRAHARQETLPDTYGLPAQVLADQLDAFRRRAQLSSAA